MHTTHHSLNMLPRTNYYVVYSRENAFPPSRINPPFPHWLTVCHLRLFFLSFFYLSPPIQLFREKYCIQYIPRRTTSTFIKYKQFYTSRPLLAFTTSHLGFRQVFLRHNENRSVFEQFPVARISSLFMHRSLLAAGRILVAAR